MHKLYSVLENETHKFSGILRFKQILSYRQDDQTKEKSTKVKKREFAEYWILLSQRTTDYK